ncbi:hypothetical protein GCM10011512_08760 [Tersicoccus solisilvae]|uniref:HNH nuclease domain-containing protein n=1 Tax=Tersicoccus solisilvae TaxID=1882339 RepID=A0ABQ1NS77_9MICC|nr:HNH endonuclease signature motif containing protein [Tersicoccus solisilvae]GGC84184.1 hypothetical protein GCM10011512_08760 [Tersicoccus solisilvae]
MEGEAGFPMQQSRPTTAVLPGLPDAVSLLAATTPRAAGTGHPDHVESAGSQDPAVEPVDALAGILRAASSGADGLPDLTASVGALDVVRRLESLLAWAKNRLILQTMRASCAEQTRWVDAHPELDDDLDRLGQHGLSRAQRVAVGERSGVAEIACALRISEAAAHGMLIGAELLAERLTSTDAALRNGEIAAPAASLIAAEVGDYAADLASAPDEATHDQLLHAIEATENGLLDAARRGDGRSKLSARARRLHEQCHPQTFSQRHSAALTERFVRISPDRDGMARLSALLPSAVAYRIDGRLSALARSLQQTECAEDAPSAAKNRTVAQLRADVLTDLLGGLVSDVDVLTAGLSGAAAPSSPDGQPAQPADGQPARRGPTGGRTRPAPVPDDDASRAVVRDVAPVPQVVLTVPAATLLGDGHPGDLSPLGPIAAEEARRLAGLAVSFSLVVTAGGSPPTRDGPSPHPPMRDRLPEATSSPPLHEAGAGPLPTTVIPVAVADGRQYRIPQQLRRALAVRDVTCRFPGCRRLADRCDVDHVTAWVDGGRTEADNLAHLCRKHHVLKHQSGWSVEVDGPGRSPSSRGSWTPDDTLRCPSLAGREQEGADPGTGTDDAARSSAAPRSGWFAEVDRREAAARLTWTSPAGRTYVADPEDPPF